MLARPALVVEGDELLEQSFVEPARRTVVDVLDRRLAVTQLGAAQPALEALGVAVGRLTVEQQRQPFGVIQILGSVLRLQVDEGVGRPRGLKTLPSSVGGWVSIACLFFSERVTGATDVGVRYRRPVRGGCGPLAIEVGLQDRGD